MVGVARQYYQPGHTQTTPAEPEGWGAHERQRPVTTGAGRADLTGCRKVEPAGHAWRDRAKRRACIHEESKRPGITQPHRDRHAPECVGLERQGHVAAGRRRQPRRQHHPPARQHHRCLDLQRAAGGDAMS
jgi:hypothetical protein